MAIDAQGLSVMTSLDHPLPFTVFSALSKCGGTTVAKGTLGMLLRLLENGSKSRKKEELGGWSPGVYVGGHRLLAKVLSVSCMVLDIDNEANKARVPEDQVLTVDAMLAKLEGREAIVYTSFRCKPDWPKFRVILPLSRPVGAEEYYWIWEWLTKDLKVMADPQCKDPSRMWYLSNPKVAEVFKVEHQTGELLDVNTIMALKPPEKPRMVVVTPEGLDRRKVVERAIRYAAKCPPAIEKQQGHRVAYSVVRCVVRGFDLDDTEAMEALEGWNCRCDPDWSDKELLHKIHQARKNGKSPEFGEYLTKQWERGKPPPMVPLTEDEALALGILIERV